MDTTLAASRDAMQGVCHSIHCGYICGCRAGRTCDRPACMQAGCCRGTATAAHAVLIILTFLFLFLTSSQQ